VADARGDGVFGLEEVANTSALAAAEFIFDAGDAGKPKIYKANGAVFIDKDVAGMNVGMDDVLAMQVCVCIQDGEGHAQKGSAVPGGSKPGRDGGAIGSRTPGKQQVAKSVFPAIVQERRSDRSIQMLQDEGLAIEHVVDFGASLGAFELKRSVIALRIFHAIKIGVFKSLKASDDLSACEGRPWLEKRTDRLARK
jgi:hypothetical protein